jgi:hypothetical protein
LRSGDRGKVWAAAEFCCRDPADARLDSRASASAETATEPPGTRLVYAGRRIALWRKSGVALRRISMVIEMNMSRYVDTIQHLLALEIRA